MILSFKQKINEEPTYFVEKIWSGIRDMEVCDELANYLKSPYSDPKVNILDLQPKIHTIRFMTPKRAEQWKGKLIDFVINNRTPNYLRFAPRVPVVQLKEIEFVWDTECLVALYYDRQYIGNAIIDKDRIDASCDPIIRNMAVNDGFGTYEVGKFLDFFSKEKIDLYEKEGKLPYMIHWTDYNEY